MRTAWALPMFLLLVGCNHYEIFNIAGYEQSDFSNKADILFLIDNSSSMADEAAALALNFDTFIGTLASSEGGTPATEDLSDAVDNYVTEFNDRGRIIDYQLAITTTTVDYTASGDEGAIDPGEAGLLLGDPTVISRTYPSVADAFTHNLLCEATCWSASAVEDVESYNCGDDPQGVISEQYLDCICGADAWKDHCGAGTEEHLEAILLAYCRAAAEPPEICYDDISPFTASDVGTNPGFLRDDSTAVVVIVTDEGDTSRRLENGDEDPEIYAAALEEFGFPIRVAVIGPDYDQESGSFICNSGGATTWGAERLINLADATSGFYNPIEETTDSECATTDFSVHLNDLGSLLNSLSNVFQLQTIPDVETIRVYVDGEPIPEAIATTDETTGEITYDAGWSYDPSQNAVVFWGDTVPDYNQDVRIYYLPLDGKPRELPF